MNKLLKLAKATGNHAGSMRCNILEKLIQEATIEFLVEMKKIGNDNTKINKDQLIENIQKIKN
jgi:hypothetical protein